MRKYSLRQTANRYLQTDNRGSFKDKKHRAYVINKVIADLYASGHVPSTWQGIHSEHIFHLVAYWKKQRLQDVTIMRYMTVMRRFLNDHQIDLENIDNKSLNLCRKSKSKKKREIPLNLWQFFHEKCPHFIMALQMQFGLTFNEAIRLNPVIHIQPERLWITREIAFNSQDRTIPIRTKEQESILNALKLHLNAHKSLLDYYGENEIRTLWNKAMKSCRLPIRKSYRFCYAKRLQKMLSPTLDNYQLSWLIRDEMGVKSRNTLWLYLNE